MTMTEEQLNRAGDLVDQVSDADDTETGELSWRVGVSLIAAWLTGVKPDSRRTALQGTIAVILQTSEFAAAELDASGEGKPH